MWVIGQLCDGSHGSWVTKDDPFPSLVLVSGHLPRFDQHGAYYLFWKLICVIPLIMVHRVAYHNGLKLLSVEVCKTAAEADEIVSPKEQEHGSNQINLEHLSIKFVLLTGFVLSYAWYNK